MRSYRRVGTSSWTTASKSSPCMSEGSRRAHYNNTVDPQRLHTRSCTPRLPHSPPSSTSVPLDTLRSSPPRTPSRCSSRRCPVPQPAWGGCSRPPHWRRRNQVRRPRSRWTPPAWQAGRRPHRRIPRRRSRSLRWSRRISRWSPWSRGFGPRGGRTIWWGRRMLWTGRVAGQSRWWRVEAFRRRTKSLAKPGSYTCLQL